MGKRIFVFIVGGATRSEVWKIYDLHLQDHEVMMMDISDTYVS